MLNDDIKEMINKEQNRLPSPEIPTKKQSRKISKVHIGLIIVPFILYFGFLCYFPINRANIGINYPFQLDAEEGFILNQACQILTHNTIYKSIATPPYLVSNYGPVFPFIYAEILKTKSVQPNIQFGRILAISALFGIFMAMIVIVSSKGRMLFPALLAPMLVLTTYDVYDWLPYARVDTLALFFSVCGIMAIVLEDTASSRYLALLLFVAAFFTKTNQIAAPIATAVYLLIKDSKIGYRWIKVYFLLVIILLGALIYFTKFEFFKHTVLYNANIMDKWQLKRWFIHLSKFQAYLLLCSLIIFFLEIIGAFTKYSKSEIAAGDFKFGNYLLFSFRQINILYYYYFFVILSFVQIAKMGSSTNYLIEIHIVVALVVCVKLSEALYEMERKRWFRNIAPLPASIWLIIIMLYLGMHSYNIFKYSIGTPTRSFNIRNYTIKDLIYSDTYLDILKSGNGILFSAPNPDKKDMEDCIEILSIINEHRGPVFAEEPIFNILSDRNVMVQPFIMTQLSKEKKWDQSPLVEKFKQGYFSLIIANCDLMNDPTKVFYERYTEEMIYAIQYRYRLYKDIGADSRTHYYIYIPRKWNTEKFNFNIAMDNLLKGRSV